MLSLINPKYPSGNGVRDASTARCAMPASPVSACLHRPYQPARIARRRYVTKYASLYCQNFIENNLTDLRKGATQQLNK